jgi:RNA polymerase sigma-70 factor, ECF subfamily
VDLSAGLFREIVEEHQRMVYSLALRVVSDCGLAEEVAQDVFLELHRKQQEIEDAGHLKYWLRRVAVHRAIDQVRRRSARPELLGEDFDEEMHGDAAGIENASESGRHLGLANRVESMVGSLPAVQRAVVTLRFQEELDPEEIAQMMGVPVATVKSHLQRALQMLRRKAAVVLKEYTRD